MDLTAIMEAVLLCYHCSPAQRCLNDVKVWKCKWGVAVLSLIMSSPTQPQIKCCRSGYLTRMSQICCRSHQQQLQQLFRVACSHHSAACCAWRAAGAVFESACGRDRALSTAQARCRCVPRLFILPPLCPHTIWLWIYLRHHWLPCFHSLSSCFCMRFLC